MIGLLVALLQAAWGLYYSHSLMDSQRDEGVSLEAGERILRGQVPYRDFFEEIGPGMPYFTAGVLGVFGTSLLTARWTMTAIAVLTAALLYRCSRALLPALPAGLSTALYVVVGLPSAPMLNYQWLTTLTSVAAVAACLPWRGRHVPWRLAASGALCAFSALTLQSRGAVLMVALGGLACAMAGPGRRWFAALTFGSGVLAIALPSLTYLALAGAAPQLFDQAVVLVVTRHLPTTAVNMAMDNLYVVQDYTLRRAIRMANTLLVLALPLVVGGVALWRSRGRAPNSRDASLITRHPHHRALWLFGLGLLAMIAGVLYHYDQQHAIAAFPLMLPLLVYECRKLIGAARPAARGRARLLAGAALAVILLPLTRPYQTLHVITHTFDPERYRVTTPRGRLYAESAALALDYRQALTFIGEKGDPRGIAWIGLYEPMMYFLSGTVNPTPADYLAPAVSRPELLGAVAEAILQSKPRAAVWLLHPDMDPARALERTPLRAVLERCYALVAEPAADLELREYDPRLCGEGP